MKCRLSLSSWPGCMWHCKQMWNIILPYNDAQLPTPADHERSTLRRPAPTSRFCETFWPRALPCIFETDQAIPRSSWLRRPACQTTFRH
jgi:hypothetical protein